MLKKLFIMALALGAVSVSAQQPRLADEFTGVDNYANIYKPSIEQRAPISNPLQQGSFEDEIANQQMIDDMLDLAKTYRGVRYVRGGSSPKGFDCSGFTSYIYGRFGYKLHRSSGAQYSDGYQVANNEIQAGDLVFFKGRNAGSSRIGHVGIAISADPETGVVTFIHAACSTGISISTTSEPYYSKRFVGARRIID